MKLAACYTVFNGTELLSGSISQIIDHVDVLLVCFQNVSNTGEHDCDIERRLAAELPNSHKLRLVHFQPDLSLRTKLNEINKHNLMLSELRALECTHFVMMACDHYYEGKKFAEAKEKAIGGDYDVTFSNMFTYYKHPNWRLEPIEDYMMPFIMKVHPAGIFRFACQYPEKVDPALKYFPCASHYTFARSELMLHHFSMIRIDIENKFRNAAASVNWSPERVEKFISEYKNAKVGNNVLYFKGRKIVYKASPFEISL